jgi:hypothetical protein
MLPFRRVEDRRAGPAALGILIPPGLRTVVILRPRPLRWDLLPLRPAGQGEGFCAFDRDEAAGVARRLQRALEEAAHGGNNPVVAAADASGRFLVSCQSCGLRWVACLRTPGRPYSPAVFSTWSEATEAAAAIAGFLRPATGAQQELYFNTQNFSR